MRHPYGLVHALAAAAAGPVILCGTASAQVQPPEGLQQDILANPPGAVISLGGYAPPFGAILNPATNQLDLVPGGLLYSDCPEYFKGFGVLYSGTFDPGPVRVYLYHVNDISPATSARLTATVENLGEETATVEFTRKSLPGPSLNYLAVGREAGELFYTDGPLPPTITLPPGEAAVLDPVLDATTMSRGQLISAKYDLVTDQPVRITSLALPAGTETLAELHGAEALPNDDQFRQGTFTHWGKRNASPYTIRTGDGTKRLRIADGAFFANDPPIPGLDEQRGVETTLPGNFGVTYEMEALVTHDDGRRLALLVNPRGGTYGGYFRTTYPADTGEPAGQLAPTPALAVASSSDAAIIAKLPLLAGENMLRLEFIPAGASNLPIEILLVPFDDPDAEMPEEPLPDGFAVF